MRTRFDRVPREKIADRHGSPALRLDLEHGEPSTRPGTRFMLVLAGVALGSTVSTAFYIVAGFVGAGLMFAGLTGSCALARVLRLMPWNRRMA